MRLRISAKEHNPNISPHSTHSTHSNSLNPVTQFTNYNLGGRHKTPFRFFLLSVPVITLVKQRHVCTQLFGLSTPERNNFARTVANSEIGARCTPKVLLEDCIALDEMHCNMKRDDKTYQWCRQI